MNVEQLLDETIRPDVGHVDADWAGVASQGRARKQRRSVLSRVGVLGLFCLFILLRDVVFPAKETDVVTEPLAGGTIPDGGQTQLLFPTFADVFAAQGVTAASVLTVWLVVLSPPLIAGWLMWRKSRRAGLSDLALSRKGRALRALGASLATSLSMIAATCVALLFFYDPLAVLSGSSRLLMAIQLLASMISWTVVALALVKASDQQDSFTGWVFAGLAGVLVWLAVNFLFALCSSALHWTQTISTQDPGRGLWRVLMPSEDVFLSAGWPISPVNAWIAIAVTTVCIIGGLRLAYHVTQTRPDEFAKTEELRPRDFHFWSSGCFLVIGIGLLAFTVIHQDVDARSSLGAAQLGPDIVNAADLSVRTSTDRSFFDENRLFEIVLKGEPGRFDDVTAADLLGRDPSQFDPEILGTGVERVEFSRIGWGTEEIWEITRSDDGSSVRIEAFRVIALFGLNTTIFLSILCFLAATSSRLRNALPEQIAGRVAASWYAVVGSIAIGVRFVNSLNQLEADVGTRESRGGASLFDVYTSGLTAELYPDYGVALPDPVSLHQISGWLALFNAFALLPLFWLASIGLRRLGIAKKQQYLLAVVACLAVAIFAWRFGDLILDWFNWFLD